MIIFSFISESVDFIVECLGRAGDTIPTNSYVSWRYVFYWAIGTSVSLLILILILRYFK